jgi:hypothetical protein
MNVCKGAASSALVQGVLLLDFDLILSGMVGSPNDRGNSLPLDYHIETAG